MSRVRGRPRSGDKPAVNWEEVDSRLVHGETTLDEGGGVLTRYPSYRELGEEFRVAHTLVAKYAKKHGCLARREQAERRFREVKDQRIAEFRGDQVAIQIDDKIRMIDRCLLKFEEMIKDGKVQISPADFNTLCRLKLFLQGDAESRQEVMSGPTLDELQRRHRECLDEYAKITPEMTGIVVKEKEDLNDEAENDKPLPPKPTLQ